MIWNVQSIMTWSIDYLNKREIPSARLDVELLLAHTLSVSRIQLYVEYDRPLNEDEKSTFRELLKQRSEGVPIAYLTGVKEFMGFDFMVNPDVLIPRPDTETIVEYIIEHFTEDPVQCLEVGVGSGCIGLSLTKLRPNWQLTGWDISEAAVKVAQENANRLDVEAQVNFIVQDGLDHTAWQGEQWDLVVSNPPYIGDHEHHDVDDGVKKYEPHLALFPGGDGLRFYEMFSQNAFSALKPGGSLIVEFGWQQAESVTAMLQRDQWQDVVVIKDLSGHNRGAIAKKPLLADS